MLAIKNHWSNILGSRTGRISIVFVFTLFLGILILARLTTLSPPTANERIETKPPAAPSSSPPGTESAPAGPTPASAYPIGDPTLTELYVSPTGNDANSGLTSDAPLQTLTAAWGMIPADLPLTATGYRINLLPGVYPCEPAEPDDCQNYWGHRLGAYQFPVILRAYSGPGTVTIRGGFDLNTMSYLYLLDLTLAGGMPLPTNASGNNLLHLSNVDHVLLRRVTLAGPDCAADTCNNLQETLKVNQAQYLYVEDSVIGGAWHSAVDYFSVQYGHLLNSRLHTAGQWCMYVKGGSAYLRVDSNELYNCQLGFGAGQSANFAVMRSPWLHYEVYDTKFVNNVLHDLPGVGLSVMGGYNILFAYNTLYRVGASEMGYPLLESVRGERGCTATDELPLPVPTCQAFISQGGWGPNYLTDNLPAIPNRNVYIYNNLIYNPPPLQTLYTHLNILGPLARPAGFQNMPDPVTTDDNLVLAGNLIWNGPVDHPLGVDDTTGCSSANPTCNTTQLVMSNTINSIQPQLTGSYRPMSGSNIYSATTYTIPNFTWSDAPTTPVVPIGTLTNTVLYDRAGDARPASGPPGAYVNASAPLTNFLYLPLTVR
jgi:hypothetical protein